MRHRSLIVLWVMVVLAAVQYTTAAVAGVAGTQRSTARYANASIPPSAGSAVELWVDPVNGSDSADGSSRSQALHTLAEAWRRIPAGVTLTTGYSILLVAGEYPESSIPTYWEDRHGTSSAPIVLRAVDSPRSARIQGSINLYDTEHLYLVDLVVENDGDVFHCELCRHLGIYNVEMDGGARQAHETIKINQSQHITIEQSDIHGSYENAIDFVAVQYATLRNNRIYDADDWCVYVKGGSAYITVEGNEIFNCGTGGFTAGQGTGFEYMVSPWLHYEAYAVRAVNNLIHDTAGAGLGVNGGYAVLYAYNTLYRVGTRSHLLEVVHGGRSCDGDAARCTANHAVGGWGPVTVGDEAKIPDRNVFIYNNLIVNPAGVQSQWQHLTVHGPIAPPAGLNVPSPAVTDDNLQIVGNVLWNGPASHALGIGEESGCQPTNPTCSAQQLLADNAINQVEPRFVDAAAGDFRVANPAELPEPHPLPDFPAWDPLTPSVPAVSDLRNRVEVDAMGRQRSGFDLVGALAKDEAPPAPSPTAAETSTPTAPLTPPAPAAGGALYLPLLQRQIGAAASPTATPVPATPVPTATPPAGVTPAPAGAVHLVALGDSLTEGDGDDGGGFPARLELFLQGVRSGSTVRNLGRSGWTSEGILQGVNGEPSQLSLALARLGETSGAKVATLWIGSNDLWYLYDARDEPMTDEQEQENLSTYTANVRTVVAQLHGAGARVLIGLLDDQSLRPVVANPPNPAEPAFPSISADDLTRMSQQVANYNAALRALAAETDNVAVVDFYNTTIFTDPATLADDGNHPNSAGYAAISALWQSLLSLWLEESK